ncbi:hypothetical protein [Amnibacterium kyonggiense]
MTIRSSTTSEMRSRSGTAFETTAATTRNSAGAGTRMRLPRAFTAMAATSASAASSTTTANTSVSSTAEV